MIACGGFMFNNSKYTKIYYQIINRALNQSRSKFLTYYENHHIIPKSIGGKDTKGNRVLLTFKEHYLCHHLLCKMVDDTKHRIKMLYALHQLSTASSTNQRNLTIYQKKLCLQANREACKNRNHKPHLGKKHSEETKSKQRAKSLLHKHTKETLDKIKLNNFRTNKSRGAKVSAANKGKIKTFEHCQKISKALFGRKMTEQSKELMRVSQRLRRARERMVLPQ
jgi:hypothetical protein